MTKQWAVLIYMALFPEVQSFEVTTLFQNIKNTKVSNDTIQCMKDS